MTKPTVIVITFRCPVCKIGFDAHLTDLTDDEAAAITAGCGNKHGRLVRMERVDATDATDLAEQTL